jgi:hypothetical protein
MKLRLAALALLALPLGACTSSNLIVEQAARAPVSVQSVNLVYGDSTVNVTDDAAAYLNERMRNAFHGGDAPAFAQGNDMTVRYRFVSYETGSRVVRYLLPGIAGGSTMIVEAEFVSPSGEVIARVRGQGNVGGGIVGGSHNSAIDSAVNQIREFAVANFRRG